MNLKPFSGRWRFTLDLFGRVFVDDVGLEPGSIISELGGFPVKEAKFRREMEKLRNSRTVDLTLSKIERERNQLIVQVSHEFVESWGSKNWILKIQKRSLVWLSNGPTIQKLNTVVQFMGSLCILVLVFEGILAPYDTKKR